MTQHWRHITINNNQRCSVKDMTNQLTDDAELDGALDLRLGADLALVQAGVPRLDVLNLQRPVIRVLGVQALEPAVGDERVPVQGEDVRVPIADPGHLSADTQVGQVTDEPDWPDSDRCGGGRR